MSAYRALALALCVACGWTAFSVDASAGPFRCGRGLFQHRLGGCGAWAGGCGDCGIGGCGDYGCASDYSDCHACGDSGCGGVVTRTVMVPHIEYETRIVKVTKYRPETRERTITVYKRVPRTREVTKQYRVMVPESKTKIVHYTTFKRVWETREKQYTVCVPRKVVKDGVRTVCQTVPVHDTVTVCEDHGHWESTADSCGDCGVSCGSGCGRRFGGFGLFRRGGCGASCGTSCDSGCGMTWFPNLVQREVPVTRYRRELVQVPYQYTATVYDREARTKTVRVPRCIPEKREKEVHYTAYRPETRTKTYQVTEYDCVPSQQVKTYQVMVPYVEEREVQVPVCRMVPREVTSPCSSCGYCSGRRSCASSCAATTDSLPLHVDDYDATEEPAPVAVPAETISLAQREVRSARRVSWSKAATRAPLLDGSGHFQQGVKLYRLGKYHAAVTEFSQACELEQANPRFRYLLAVSQWRTGADHAALKSARIGMKLEGHAPGFDWGRAMERFQDPGRKWLERLRQSSPSGN